MIIRPQNGLDADFCQRVLSSGRAIFAIENSSVGSTMVNLNQKTLSELFIQVPPPIEQLAIGEALADADALDAKLDTLIAKKRDLKQAAMQQLLTGQTRLPGFNGAWQTRRVSSFSAFVTKGATPTTYGFKWEADGVRFLRSECVSAQGLDLTESMFISEHAHSMLIRGEVRPGDILITITGNVGRVVLLDSNIGVANINQHIARIRVNDAAVSPAYVFHWLSQPGVRQHLGTIMTGQAYPQISLKQVRETQIPLGSLAEQTAIAAVLSDMDAELATLESRRDKTRSLKQGMMQELLTGRIRLI
jgi:type I restriction enzyme, S subunit